MIIGPGMDEPARRSAFASMVAHELRTPLTAIYGALEIMSRGSPGLDPAHAATLVGLAHRNASRLMRIVEDCLDLEAVSDGRLNLQLARVEPMAILELAVAGAQSAREQTSVEVELHVQSNRAVVGDRARLGRALAHLIQNAVTFAPPGSPVIVIAQDAPTGNAIRFTVEDHGPGVDPELLAQLFQHFDVRQAAGRRRIGGLGMGLAFVRAMATAHGGEVGVRSGQGETKFWMDIATEGTAER